MHKRANPGTFGTFDHRMTDYGAHASPTGTTFTIRSSAESVTLCLFDGDTERRVPMARDGEHWTVEVPGIIPGQCYGYRANGRWAPDEGLFFDSAKLLVDPYAIELDRPFTYAPRLSLHGEDTADLVPRAIVQPPAPDRPPLPPLFRPGGLIYELNVRGFTMRHPDVPEAQRGTVAALAHPAVVAHLKKIGVAAVELMPVTAWIDERHLPPLGLSNAWGYNPVAPMALDPRLCPGGVAELRATVAALRAAGIGVILDLVFNHTGDSDRAGPVLSMRGLGEALWYARAPDGGLINDTGCGNTLDFGQEAVRRLTLDTLRHFAMLGVDGFRFDLAPILARSPGFHADAPIFAEIAADPVLATRVMIAEPWDIGPDGYQLGHFPDSWLEWNDRWRDDVRRFWRGDGSAGDLATRIAGSADLFGGPDAIGATRSVHFVAAHDGFTLADLVAYEHRHNEANGEQNRDGHGENLSWNNGVEGPTDDRAIQAARHRDARALLATLFASKGTPLLTAGDEFGRTQGGNNNAYAQDNATTWLDWDNRDLALEDFTAHLAALRTQGAFASPAWLAGAEWLALDGEPMTPERWAAAQGFELRLPHPHGVTRLWIDRTTRAVTLEEDL
jgi:glycogen debranching enzyme